ncbi:MAG: pyrroline-5-carboxylate reductase [Deltaproteobacteria bacterium]|nr:pyrroline-5-carboxylate reductase [Deltaproteobacteria bacterium]
MTSLPPPKLDKTVAFLGAGNMAGALIKGILASGALQPEQVLVTDVRKARLEELKAKHGVRVISSNEEAARLADVVVLATKPQVFDRLLPEVKKGVRPEALVISIAAGIPVSAIEALLPAKTRVVRTMPNTPAIVDAGATAIAAGTHATEDDVALARALFDSVGVTVVLDESLLDAVTGLSGSGPAYMFLIIEALSDAGVKVGLHRDSAQLLAAQTVLGSAKLLLETGEHPGRLKDMVTSPGGTAIAGLASLEAGGLRTTLINAVETATARARTLGEEMGRKLADKG